MPSAMVKRVKRDQHDQTDQRLQQQEDRGLERRSTWPEGIGRERVRSTLRVEIAIDDVVPGAAGAAHGEGADEKQREMDEARRRLVRGNRRQVPTTTSKATTKATSRSDDRAGPAAGKDVTRPVRAVSTQLPVASATEPAAGLIAPADCR